MSCLLIQFILEHVLEAHPDLLCDWMKERHLTAVQQRVRNASQSITMEHLLPIQWHMFEILLTILFFILVKLFAYASGLKQIIHNSL